MSTQALLQALPPCLSQHHEVGTVVTHFRDTKMQSRVGGPGDFLPEPQGPAPPHPTAPCSPSRNKPGSSPRGPAPRVRFPLSS